MSLNSQIGVWHFTLHNSLIVKMAVLFADQIMQSDSLLIFACVGITIVGIAIDKDFRRHHTI
mgnify:CR=1 FL=1